MHIRVLLFNKSNMYFPYMIIILLVHLVVLSRSEEICCESTGDCYTDEPPFEGATWPLPQCLDPAYTLYRSDLYNGTVGVAIARNDTPPEYAPEDVTVYLVHGYQDFRSGWAEVTKDEFMANEVVYNVVVVDWIEGASEEGPQAVSNVRSLGSELAAMNEQLGPRYSWCVGHSLGAHACGHGGKQGALYDRISGLDPSGPNFDQPSCAAQAEECRLHPADALQVDNIHTDAEGAAAGGSYTPTGHMDFYPNGGVAHQPGCENSTTAEFCSHGYAIDLFTASINNDCFTVTHNCTDPRNLPGSCGECSEGGCPNMGAGAYGGAGIFYLQTTDTYPYCLNAS